MSGVNGSSHDVDIDLGRLLLAIWERKRTILAVTALAAGVAFVGAKMVSPSYRGEARILIESRAPVFPASEGGSGGNEAVLDALNIASQAQVLQSVDIIKQVARDLQLYDLEEFDPDTRPSALSDILVLLGISKNPLELAPEERVIRTFREKLQVYQVENSRVIAVEFSSQDPALAAAIPNAMTAAYLALQSGAKLDSNTEMARWLEPEIANLREKVREAERKIADYRASQDLLPSGETGTFAGRQLDDISTELARLRGERAAAEARAENVRMALASGQSIDTLSDVVGSQMIQRLKETESGIQSQISDLSTSLLEGHPRLKGLRAQLAGIRTQIATETRKILASLENEANVAQLRERQLMQQLNVLKADSARVGEGEVELRALEREAAAQRQLLETYLARYREAATRTDKSATPADARIISQALEPSRPYFPKVVPIVTIVALATLILSAIAVMLAELFSGRALRPSSVPAQPEVESAPPIAVLPAETIPMEEPQETEAPAVAEIASEEEVLPAVEPDDDLVAEMSEAFEVREETQSEGGEDFSIQAVADYLVGKSIPVVVSVSPSGDDGSTATVMLAREVAGTGRSVLLVDMTASACPTYLMAEDRDLPGITDLLCGEAAFGDTIHGDRLSNAHIIPQGTADVQRAMRGADRLTMIIDALADAYDCVIIECGSADVNGVSRLTRSGPVEIVLSIPQPDEQELIALMEEFGDAGYTDVLLMSGMGVRQGRSGRSGRHAA